MQKCINANNIDTIHFAKLLCIFHIIGNQMHKYYPLFTSELWIVAMPSRACLGHLQNHYKLINYFVWLSGRVCECAHFGWRNWFSPWCVPAICVSRIAAVYIVICIQCGSRAKRKTKYVKNSLCKRVKVATNNVGGGWADRTVVKLWFYAQNLGFS